MKNFLQHQQSDQSTPQTQPIPGQEEMIQGRSGGYMFQADAWQVLRRCLLLGTANGTYYASRHELTNEFINAVRDAIQIDPQRAASEIVYASDGRSINNSAPILALVLLSMDRSPEAKRSFQEIFPLVVRTGSHFYEWISYTKSMRGFGKIVREAGQSWLMQADVKALAYQLLKYQQRQGFSHRDALRLFHVKPPTDDHNQLFQWVLNGWDSLPDQIPAAALAQIWWYEWLKRHPEQTDRAIQQGDLTHEMAAPVGRMDRQAWQLLFDRMPIGAMLRNLGSLTEIGVLERGATANLARVAKILTDRNRLRTGRIHPIDMLKALKTYRSGGQLGRSQKTWQPVPRVIDCLELALARSFEMLKPTGKVFLHALDVSGSMSYFSVPSINMSCCEIATTMALATAKAERHYVIRGFSTEFLDLQISAKDSFSTAIHKASSQNFGGTDASVAYRWAIEHRFKADVFCFWTDCESWAGQQHPSQALARYRRKVNPNAKAIYVTLVPNRASLVDPQDASSWNIAGFDPGAPRMIQMLATENL